MGALRTIGRQRVPPEVIETPVLGPALAGKDPIAPPPALELPATDARTAASSSSQVLALESVSKAFGGIKVLDKVTVSFEQGERTAIIGPNGAGKTTLFNLITGLEPVSEGRIAVLGTDVTRRPATSGPSASLQVP